MQEEDIGILLSVLKSLNISKNIAKQKLIAEYELSEMEADKKLELYWWLWIKQKYIYDTMQRYRFVEKYYSYCYEMRILI